MEKNAHDVELRDVSVRGCSKRLTIVSGLMLNNLGKESKHFLWIGCSQKTGAILNLRYLNSYLEDRRNKAGRNLYLVKWQHSRTVGHLDLVIFVIWTIFVSLSVFEYD